MKYFNMNIEIANVQEKFTPLFMGKNYLFQFVTKLCIQLRYCSSEATGKINYTMFELTSRFKIFIHKNSCPARFCS